MKIKFHSDNDLPLNRALILWILNLIFIKGPNISQRFSQKNVCISYKCYNIIASFCLNDLRDFHYRYFLEINFTSDPKVFDGCYDLMQLLLSKKVIAELRSST